MSISFTALIIKEKTPSNGKKSERIETPHTVSQLNHDIFQYIPWGVNSETVVYFFHRTQLKKEDTAEWKEKEARAQRLAAEIEQSDTYRRHLELENGDDADGDEEMKYSAVIRAGEASNAGTASSGASAEGSQGSGSGK